MPRRLSKADALAEIARRGLQARTKLDWRARCHPKQARLVETLVTRRARYVVALCGRQSGKSHGAVMGALELARQTADIAVLYATSTDASVRKMAFEPAQRMNRDYALGAEPNLADRTMRFPNGSVVYFIGADSDRTIERLRGTPNLALCIIDECGLYESEKLSKMIEAVTPGLRPLAGALVLMGTPSLQGTQGTWYEATENDRFEQHRFSYLDNDRVPSFADVERLIDEELVALGYVTADGEPDRTCAYFRREYLCEFVVDLAEKVYQLAEGNYYDGEPPAGLTKFVVGGDLGVGANDALVTLGWEPGAFEVWVVEEQEASGQDSLAFAAMVRDVHERRKALRIAVDPGGLGQKTIKTVRALMPALPIVEASKPPVSIQVRAVNVLLQGGRLRVPRRSKLARELASPTWVDGIVGGEIDEHGHHSDLVPALRYGVLAATPYLPKADGFNGHPSLKEEPDAAELRAKYNPPAMPPGMQRDVERILGPRWTPGNRRPI